jgi:hypothetical protein
VGVEVGDGIRVDVVGRVGEMVIGVDARPVVTSSKFRVATIVGGWLTGKKLFGGTGVEV